MSDDDDRHRSINHLRPNYGGLEDLVDCGPDRSVVKAVDTDGTPVLFVVDWRHDEWARCYDCPPEHEELGPLPDDVWLRLWPVESSEEEW